jgi:hypothetical protein
MREPKIRGIKKCRCDERLETKTKEFTRLPYTGLVRVYSMQSMNKSTCKLMAPLPQNENVMECFPELFYEMLWYKRTKNGWKKSHSNTDVKMSWNAFRFPECSTKCCGINTQEQKMTNILTQTLNLTSLRPSFEWDLES